MKRYERIRNDKVDPREDNALAITTDGRKLALDGRMLAAAPDFAGSKINALVDKVESIWRHTEASRGTQMIFCDMGVNPTAWGFSAYGEITSKLIDRGIPSQQIASIGDADSDAKKQALFDRVRSGQVRILLGSTAKMGTGTNVQKRLVALHHLDAPWKPAEVEQREGRILRQGNENKEVAIYRYVTEGSFDAYMWQALETKARFISQVITGNNAARRAEDVGGQELSYAEVKAIASGNPAVLTLAEADAELQRLTILQKNHADEQFLARRNIRVLPETIERLTQRLANLTTDRETSNAHVKDRITIANRAVSYEDEVKTLGVFLDSLPKTVAVTQRFPLGIYRGLHFGLVRHAQFSPELYLEGAITRHEPLSRDHHGPRAILNALENLACSYGTQCESTQKELTIAQAQLRDYQVRLGAPFTHESYFSELTQLRDQLKAGLSAAAPASEAEQGPSVVELAERIKALKAGHNVEAVPPRATKRATSAEEPVTVRIRRRAEAIAASHKESELLPDASPVAASTGPESMDLGVAGRIIPNADTGSQTAVTKLSQNSLLRSNACCAN